MSKQYYRTLTIAGSDSGGGAGIQADLKTFSSLGCYGMSVITALTAQNTKEVREVLAIDPIFVKKQIQAVMDDIGVDAVKIGMLQTPEIIKVVADTLALYEVKKIILDPVMVAKSGDKLLLDESIDALKELLFPLATIITPNVYETKILLGLNSLNANQAKQACRDLLKLGSNAVLLKGGHLGGDLSSDWLATGSSIQKYSCRRIETNNLHGTGCTLSSAITGFLAKDYSLENAVKEAKNYISKAISTGRDYKLGQGHGPVHHFASIW
jgi:hydroxymethylpyrimidine/phosphomethylpyrimidine kinase